MARCARCHHDFARYAALSQHFDAKHHGAAEPSELAKELVAEKGR